MHNFEKSPDAQTKSKEIKQNINDSDIYALYSFSMYAYCTLVAWIGFTVIIKSL